MSQEHRRRHSRDLSKQTKYVELALIGDYEYVKQHGYSDEDSLTYMLEAVNIADLMFSRDMNVRLSVVYAEIWLDVQRVDLFEDIERTMSGVVDYSTGHIYNIAKDASILFTGGSFANKEAVNAVFRSICTARSTTIVKVRQVIC
ncbi:reprolysin family zinc metalloprotease [Cooperia oncophora]